MYFVSWEENLSLDFLAILAGHLYFCVGLVANVNQNVVNHCYEQSNTNYRALWYSIMDNGWIKKSSVRFYLDGSV